MPTEMRRITISIPEELSDKLENLKNDERFKRCSYSEIIRQFMKLAIEADEHKVS